MRYKAFVKLSKILVAFIWFAKVTQFISQNALAVWNDFLLGYSGNVCFNSTPLRDVQRHTDHEFDLFTWNVIGAVDPPPLPPPPI